MHSPTTDQPNEARGRVAWRGSPVRVCLKDPASSIVARDSDARPNQGRDGSRREGRDRPGDRRAAARCPRIPTQARQPSVAPRHPGVEPGSSFGTRDQVSCADHSGTEADSRLRSRDAARRGGTMSAKARQLDTDVCVRCHPGATLRTENRCSVGRLDPRCASWRHRCRRSKSSPRRWCNSSA